MDNDRDSVENRVVLWTIVGRARMVSVMTRSPAWMDPPAPVTA
ncbi:MAG: hypothetical protein ACXWW6_03500 [Candidatus Limnocylindrales bacterium]